MANENRFLVICIPDSLTFYLNDPQSCKQEIKIYNINNSDMRFKVLCTSVDNYKVNPPSGSVRKGCMIGVTIELRNHGFNRKSDIFKINAYTKDRDRLLGEKEIMARILPEKPLDEKPLEEKTESNKENNSKTSKSTETLNNTKQSNTLSNTITLDNPQNVVVISTGRFCFYVVLIFLFGIITGMILNAPQEIKID